MLVSAVAEVVSLGAVVPFLAILTSPERVFAYPVVAKLALTFGITSASQLLLPVTFAFAAAAVITGAIRMFLLWVSTRLTSASGSELSSEVYRRTLYQPYRAHVARNSSEIISGIINKVNGVVFGVMLPLLMLVSSTILLVSILLALIAINPLAALVATVGFGASYGVITWRYRRRLYINGQRIGHEQTQVLKALQEGLGGIRDIILDGAQPIYCDIYRQADLPFRQSAGDNSFIGQSPRYTMEAIGMVLIVSLAYGLSRQAGGIATAMPVLGALALGAQRLLPALHQIYSAWTSIAGNQAQLTDTIEMLEQPLPLELQQPEPEPLVFNEAIRFESVGFRYSKDGSSVLDGLTFTIPKGARVGFVGSTGSGKSTTLDLLMGLLTPDSGKILVDGIPIAGTRRRAWQRAIAHVPQSIYLADTTLAENIAFGVPRADINMELARQAARQARIADFIESRPGGYNAYVGERGIRLSGGERQRIGIARALYKQACVLVFDEATSALDSATERAVMDAIEGVNRDVTILLIAHRLTTLRRCDTIFELEHGRVAAQGSYEQLLESSPAFRQAAQGPQSPERGDKPEDLN
ncbi:MAG TPA: ABC transporter ATP-binding protein [Elusimicrobia bacterium]|nr:ABC transporter ATP-binding protein [Elusimicrobiota bacterium]